MGQVESRSIGQTKREAEKQGAYVWLKTISARTVFERERWKVGEDSYRLDETMEGLKSQSKHFTIDKSWKLFVATRRIKSGF